MAGAELPLATAVGFTAAGLDSLGNHIMESHENWDNYTPSQKTAALVDIGGDVAMTLLAAKGGAETKERKPNATQIQQEQTSVQQQRPGTGESGSSAEAGGGDSLRRKAESATAPQLPSEKQVTPAIQVAGKVFTGKDHVDAYAEAKANGQPDTSGAQEGFVDDKGKFITREQAAKETGLPTATEKGKLHSSDLPDETQPATPTSPPETGQPPTPTPVNPVPAQAEVPIVDQPVKYKIGTSPQTHTIVETLPQSEVEKANGEQPVKIKNDKTGAVQTVMQSDLTPVQDRTGEAKTPKRDLDAELKAAKLDPSSFPNDASKRAALKRAAAMAYPSFRQKAETLASKLEGLKRTPSNKIGRSGKTAGGVNFGIAEELWNKGVEVAQAHRAWRRHCPC